MTAAVHIPTPDELLDLSQLSRDGYHGLRVTEEEWWTLPDDGRKYELVDGVVIMSPSATPQHQLVSAAVFRQLSRHVDERKLGVTLYEVDVNVGKLAGNRAIIYRPEIVFIAAANVPQIKGRIEVRPELVVEIVSPDSRTYDRVTKLRDYERAGIPEYWLFDPERDLCEFHRLANAKYAAVAAADNKFESVAVPGLVLDLVPIKAAFREL